MNFDKLRRQVVVGSHKVPTGAVQSTKCLCVNVKAVQSRVASCQYECLKWGVPVGQVPCSCPTSLGQPPINAKRLPLSTVRNIPSSSTPALCTPLCHAQFIRLHAREMMARCLYSKFTFARQADRGVAIADPVDGVFFFCPSQGILQAQSPWTCRSGCAQQFRRKVLGRVAVVVNTSDANQAQTPWTCCGGWF